MYNFTYMHSYNLTNACTFQSIFLASSLLDAASGREGHKLKDFSPPLLECIIAWCTLPPTKLELFLQFFTWPPPHLSYHWVDLWSNLDSVWNTLNNRAIFWPTSGYQLKTLNNIELSSNKGNWARKQLWYAFSNIGHILSIGLQMIMSTISSNLLWNLVASSKTSIPIWFPPDQQQLHSEWFLV